MADIKNMGYKIIDILYKLIYNIRCVLFITFYQGEIGMSKDENATKNKVINDEGSIINFDKLYPEQKCMILYAQFACETIKKEEDDFQKKIEKNGYHPEMRDKFTEFFPEAIEEMR